MQGIDHKLVQDLSITSVQTPELTSAQLSTLRTMLRRSFGAAYDDSAWLNCLGGTHLIVRIDSRIVAHAAVIERRLYFDDRVVPTGYLESVATVPEAQRQLLGTLVTAAASAHALLHFEIGALATRTPAFYSRLGWTPWLGEMYVRKDGAVSKARPHGDVLLLARHSHQIPASRSLSAEWREGDVW